MNRDGFAAGENIVTDKSLNKIAFTVENRTGDEHTTELFLSLPTGSTYSVFQNGRTMELNRTGNGDYPLRTDLSVTSRSTKIEIIRE